MRNLAAGNKINFTLFIFIVIIILVLIICAVIIVLKADKEEYQVTSSAFIYDDKYNYIELENPATISKKWTGSYYLKEDSTNKEYKLGNYAISYEKSRNALDLFGNFYQVFSGGNISKISGYNTINVSYENKFYKIDDRKYLIVARDIKNNTGSLSTQNYLIVILDKLGNALLLNDKINAKTINEMIISTDDFDFDIANEQLIFGENQVDLKKIIGSTNEYTKPQETEDNNIEENNTEENSTEENNNEQGGNVIVAGNGGTSTTTSTTNNNASSTTIIQNGANGINTANGITGENSEDNKWVDTLNKWIQNVGTAFESIYNKGTNKTDTTDSADSESNKNISLNGLNAGATYIDINYTVNDPNSEYNVVYAYISNGSKNYNISLDKNATTYKLTGLKPNTNYTVQLGYKIINSDATTKDTVEDTMATRTTKPNESINITKVSLDKVYYTLKLDSSFIYDAGAKIKVYIDEVENSDLGVTLNQSSLDKAASSGYSLSFKLPSDYGSISIQLEDTKYSGSSVNSDAKAKIINY